MNINTKKVTTSASPQPIFPAEKWPTALPEDLGVDSTRLEQAMEYLAHASQAEGAEEALVIRRGRVIWQGPAVDRLHPVWSVSKVFTSTVLGILVDQGKCSLDTRLCEYAPFLAEQYPTITFRHTVTMTSGYRGVGDVVGGTGSKTPFTPGEPLYPPGTKYGYNNDGMHIMAYTLTRIAAEPLKEVFARHIAAPIGMQSWEWRDFGVMDGILQNGGTNNLGKGISVTASDMARLAYLYLNKGNWNGRQLLSRSWIEQATSVQVPVEMPAIPYKSSDGAIGSGVYGFCWWVNGVTPEGKRLWPHAPAGTCCAQGACNNFCFIVPEWELILIRFGQVKVPSFDGKAVYDRVLGMIGEALV
ncbi:MAG TPA: serine hydrolase [Firmicutes bacterium]|nr:serine hydrolase [Bacillota bacterium]